MAAPPGGAPTPPPPAAAALESQLCPFSAAFDAAAALSAPLEEVERTLPTRRDRTVFRRAAPLDNLGVCASAATAPFRPLIHRPRAAAAPVAAPGAATAPAPRRRVVRADGRGAGGATVAGALPAMQRKYGAGGGPMAFLLAAFERRACVCVVMRRTHAARGRVDGLLAAFDRHLNLVLQNATIRDEGAPPRNVRLLFIRGDNVVAVCR